MCLLELFTIVSIKWSNQESLKNVRVKGGKLKNWEEKTFFNKNVVGIYDVTGEYDAFLIAKFRNTNELNAFIKELLKDPIIERTYTQTVLDVIKEDMGSSNIL